MAETKELEWVLSTPEDRLNNTENSAYITNFTLMLIARAFLKNLDLNTDEVNVFFNDLPCSAELKKFISFEDRRFLYVVDFILKNKEKHFFVAEVENYFKQRAERNNKLYVKKMSDTPKYHIDDKCPFLSSDFENFLLPEEIIANGEQAIIEFRKKFHKQSKNEDDNKIIFDMSDALEKVEAPNSGYYEYTSINDFIRGLVVKIKKANIFLNENPEVNHRKYAPTYKMRKVSTLVLDIDVEFHQEHKKLIIEDLITFILKNNEDNKSWDRRYLDRIGFTSCKMCG